MKKITNILVILFICFLFMIVLQPFAYAALGDEFDPDNILDDSTQTPVFTSQFNKIWNTVIYVARIAAFCGIIFLGVTYIFSNSDRKADLKKGLIPVVIGIVIFFGSTYIIDFIKSVFDQIR